MSVVYGYIYANAIYGPISLDTLNMIFFFFLGKKMLVGTY